MDIIITNIFYICLYALTLEIICFALRKSLSEIKSWSNRQKISAILIILLVCVFQLLFMRTFIHSERDIKTYDSTVYWIKDIQVSRHMYENMKEALKSVLSTIETQEYNNLASIFAVPLIFYFGSSFLKFICSNYLLFYLPFCLSMSLYVMRLAKKETIKWDVFIMSFLTSSFSVILFKPILDGFLDSIGLFIISLLLHITYDWDYRRIDIKTNIFLSGLSLLLLFSRRWYAFFIVGFYTAFGAEFVWEQFEKKEWKREYLRNFAINIIMIAGISYLFILLFFPGLLDLLFKNYGDAYSYYKQRTAVKDAWYYMKELGMISVGISLIGLAVGIKDRSCEEKNHLRWLCICSIVTFVLFESLQNMGEHHRYLMVPLLVVSEGALLIKACEKNRKIVINLIILGICVINFCVAFAKIDVNDPLHLLTGVRRYPIIRDDFEEINQITDVLIEETKDSNKKIYVAVDSTWFSQELLKRAKLPYVIDAMPNIIAANIIDKRDGFPSQGFLADYIVTAPTIDNSQKIISELTRLLQEDSLFREHYILLKEIYIAENVPICIYKKIKPLGSDVVEALSNCLRNHYDNEFVTKPNYFISLINVLSANSFEYYSWDNSIGLGKKEGQEIVLEYELGGEMNGIRFNVSNYCCDIRMLIYLDDELYYDEALPCDGINQFEFNVRDKNKITIKLAGDHSANISLLDGYLE